MCAGSRPECERDRDTTVGEAAHKGVPRARHGARAPNASLQFGSADTVSLRGPDCPSRLTPSRTPSAQGECQVESSAVLRVGRVSSPTLAEPLVFDMLSWLALSIAELDRYQPETGPLHRLDQASEGDGRPQRAVPTANAYGRPRGSLISFGSPLPLPHQNYSFAFTLLPARASVPSSPAAAGLAEVRPRCKVRPLWPSSPARTETVSARV